MPESEVKTKINDLLTKFEEQNEEIQRQIETKGMIAEADLSDECKALEFDKQVSNIRDYAISRLQPFSLNAYAIDQFKQYILGLEKGNYLFSIRLSGEQVRLQLNIADRDFAFLYDELKRRVGLILSHKGSVYIEEVISIGHEIIAALTAQKFSQAFSPVSMDPAQVQQHVESLLTEDIAALIVMLHNNKPIEDIQSMREKILEKASSIDRILHVRLQDILYNLYIPNQSMLTQVTQMVCKLNEDFLCRENIGFYLEAFALDGKLFLIPYRIIERKIYPVEGRTPDTEMLYIEQIAMSVSISKHGHNASGERFVCVSKDLTMETLKDIIRLLKGGAYYQSAGRAFLRPIEYLAREAIEKDFIIASEEDILSRVRFLTELHELKHNENDINGTTERLDAYVDGEIIMEALCDLTALALGTATYFELLQIFEGIVSSNSWSYPSVLIFNVLSEELEIGITIEKVFDNKSAIKIFEQLIKLNREKIKIAATKAYNRLATQVNAGPMIEGAIRTLIELDAQTIWASREAI